MGNKTRLIILLVLVVFSQGCFRGLPKEKSPIHLNPNMDTQEKYKPYRNSSLFNDGSAMRPPVEGTVPRGHLKDDEAYYFGKTVAGDFVQRSPVPFTAETLKRGQERFNIFCSPCHGKSGNGEGIVMQYNYPIPPPTFHQDRIRNMPDGELFNTISNGIRNMPSYKEQIPVPDRWAIIGYIRALQRSQNASLTDIPADRQSELK